MTDEAQDLRQFPRPWTSVQNSWQYTTIYDATGRVVCRFDLEDWDVNEENQDELEAEQLALVRGILREVNGNDG